MTSTKLKFRASSVEGKEGTLYLQVICRREVRRVAMPYRLFPSEWDARRGTVACGAGVRPERGRYLRAVQRAAEADLDRLRLIVLRLDRSPAPYRAADVVRAFADRPAADDFLALARGLAARLRAGGRTALAEKYETSLRSLGRYLAGRRPATAEIDAALLTDYERFLRRRGLCPNTTSFYLRTLRALCRRVAGGAPRAGLDPFAAVYTGVEKTRRRAVGPSDLRRLRRLRLAEGSAEALARDVFLFSLYTCGMSFADLARLRKTDVAGGYLRYRRRKTGQEITVRWEGCMQRLAERYASARSPYLLPILSGPAADEVRQCRSRLHLINRCLRRLGERLALPQRLTSYVARHSWASIARQQRVPLAAISEAMGHTSERTTRIYLRTFDNRAVDRANAAVLRALGQGAGGGSGGAGLSARG